MNTTILSNKSERVTSPLVLPGLFILAVLFGGLLYLWWLNLLSNNLFLVLAVGGGAAALFGFLDDLKDIMAKLSKDLVKPEPDENWVLITTAWHMPRSVGMFCKVGWEVTPHPVDFFTQPDDLFRVSWGFAGNLSGLGTAVQEWIGIFAYRVMERS